MALTSQEPANGADRNLPDRMSNIRNYIHHTVRPDPAKPGSEPDGASRSTKDMLAELYKLRPPLWTIVGGAHATGVSWLLEELARMRGTGAGSQETLRVVLPDEESPPMAIGRGVTQQRLELLKALRRELWAVSPPIVCDHGTRFAGPQCAIQTVRISSVK